MHRFTIQLTALVCLLVSGSLIARAAEHPPNIILVLLDDSGWTDFSSFGSRIDTPHIDRLARQGMRFTDCHSAAPNCSPSRAGLLTGRTPSRVGIFSYLPANHVMHLRSEEITIAELLKQRGYRTGHFGKWHLSRLLSDQPNPGDQGFDHWLSTDNNASPSHHNPNNFVRNGKPLGTLEGYSCQIVVDEAIDWIQGGSRASGRTAKTPFFACVWFHEPHTPIASPPGLVDKYQDRFPELNRKAATYYANIENVDRAVGRLMDALQEHGTADNTMVFLTSDNGPLNAFSKIGLRGRKSHVFEGGHRVPGIAWWPGKIPADTISFEPVSGVDYLPTICDIVDIDPPSDRVLDGTSLWPILQGTQEALRRDHPLYWFFYRLNPAAAFRVDDWLVIADTTDAQRPKAHPLIREDMPEIKRAGLTNFQLYHLSTDLAQRHDLARERPEILDRLKSRMIQFHHDVIADAPTWNIPPEYGATAAKRIWTSE